MELHRTLTLITMASLLYGTPGPAVLSLTASGCSFGFRRSVPYLTGILVGLTINIAVCGLGLAVVFTRYPTVGTIFKYASLAYVLFLAFKLVRFNANAETDATPLRFQDGLVLNLINPKAYAAAIAVLASFSQTGSEYSASFAWVFFVVMCVAVTVDIAWVWVGSALGRSRWSNNPRAWNYVFAALLVLSVFATTFWTWTSDDRLRLLPARPPWI